MCAWQLEGCAVANMTKNFPSTIVEGGSARGSVTVQGIRSRPTFRITFRTLSDMALCGGRLNITYVPATVAPATQFLVLTNQNSAISGSAPSGTTLLRVVLDYAGTINTWEIPLNDYAETETTLVIPMHGGCK